MICWFSFALKGSAQVTCPLDTNSSNKIHAVCRNLSTRTGMGISRWILYTWCSSAWLHSLRMWCLIKQIKNWFIAATKMPPENAMSLRIRTRSLHDSVTQTSCVRWQSEITSFFKILGGNTCGNFFMQKISDSICCARQRIFWASVLEGHMPPWNTKWRASLPKIRVFKAAN